MSNINMIKKLPIKAELIKDFLLNLIASAVSVGVAQLILYPWLAKTFTAAEYGIILTIMGVGNTVINSIGNSLNNVRLMTNSNYETANKKGDFMILISFLSIVGATFYSIYLIMFQSVSVNVLICLVIYVILGSLKGYGVAAYRINLNFRNNLYCNMLTVLGNFLGILILVNYGKIELWPLVFVLGEAVGLLAVLFSSDILKEPFKLTDMFRVTLGKEAVLVLTTLIANILIYLDRILLLPLLGGVAVSTFTTASFFGKFLGIIMTPIAGVLLGYYAQSSFSMTRSKFWRINSYVVFIAAVFFVLSLFTSNWITGLFYPTLIEEAKSYLLVANSAAIISVIANMTQPAVLKYAPTYTQIVIQAIYCVIYLGGGIIGAMYYGLWGFAFASIISAVARVISLYIVGHLALRS